MTSQAAKTESPSRTMIRLKDLLTWSTMVNSGWVSLVSRFKRRCHVSASHLPSHLPSGHLPASLGRWGNSLNHGLDAKKKQGNLQKLNTKHQSYASHILQTLVMRWGSEWRLDDLFLRHQVLHCPFDQSLWKCQNFRLKTWSLARGRWVWSQLPSWRNGSAARSPVKNQELVKRYKFCQCKLPRLSWTLPPKHP